MNYLHRFLAVLTFLTLQAFSASLCAAVFYLSADQPSGGPNWNTLSYWKSNPDGSGSSPLAINPGDDFYVNGFSLRTSDTAFAGNLFMAAGGTLTLKDSTGGTSTAASLTLSGGTIGNAQAYVDDLSVSTLLNSSGTTAIVTGGSQRGVLLIIGTLSGSGGFEITGNNGQSQWNVADASSYAGTLTLTTGTLNFEADFLAPSSSLNIAAAGKVTLDQAVTTSSLTIGGSSLGAGTYSYAYLSTNFASIFTAGNASGSIAVVPEPVAGSLILSVFLVTLVVRRRKHLS